MPCYPCFPDDNTADRRLANTVLLCQNGLISPISLSYFTDFVDLCFGQFRIRVFAPSFTHHVLHIIFWGS